MTHVSAMPTDESLCRGVVGSGEVAPTVATLARLLETTEAEVEARVIAAFDRGEVEPWNGDEPRVTLSPLSAERMALRLDRKGSRWVGRDKRLASLHTNPSLNKVISATDANIDFGGMRSHDPGPLELAIASEESAVDRPIGPGMRKPETIPLPTVLLGQRLQWPAAPWQLTADRPAPHASCPGCNAAPKPNEYCLVCDRYGRGWMLPKVHMQVKRAPTAKAAKKLTRKLERAERAKAKPSG